MFDPEAEYSWPVKRVTPNANPVFAVDAGADHPAGLSVPPMVCVRGVIWVFPSPDFSYSSGFRVSM